MLKVLRATLLMCAVLELALKSQALVNLNRFDNLTKEEYIALDNDASSFYRTKIWELDSQEPDYDKLLYRALRTYKHTNLINHYDYKYGDHETMVHAAGKTVDDSLCLKQLAALHALVQPTNDTTTELPISIVNLMDTWARSESAVLMGNNVWFGSWTTCIRARIPAATLASGLQQDIQGRYCMGHLRAKSWPTDDIYFDDSVAIKTAMCLPDTCHSTTFFEHEQVRELVNSLARRYMIEPFNQAHRYNITYLYCLPDDDSPLREWNFGAKLFVLFVYLWLLVFFYANWRYHKRANKRTCKQPASNDNADYTETEIYTKPVQDKKAELGSQSPVTSDIDKLTETLKEFVETTNKAKLALVASRRPSRAHAHVASEEQKLDFCASFSLESNLRLLLRERPIEKYQAIAKEPRKSLALNQRPGRRLSAQGRRVSVSETPALAGCDNGASVAANRKGKAASRVNIDIFDGIKVLATAHIVAAHTCYLFVEHGRDTKFVSDRMMDAEMAFYQNGTQAVGLFYMITGLLLTYLAFTRSARQLFKPSFWLLAAVNRYLRLVPMYALVFWFAKHVAPLTGSGGGWLDYRTDTRNVRGYCAVDSWWTTLTLSAADTKRPYGCLPQDWYLSNDFRAMLALPFYLMLLAKNQTLGYAAILATFVYSHLCQWRSLSMTKVDFHEVLRYEPNLISAGTDTLNEIYTDMNIRISTYLYGVLLGHLLYRYESGDIKQWPVWFRRYGWRLGLGLGAFIFSLGIVFTNPLVKLLLPPVDDIDGRIPMSFFLVLKFLMETSLAISILLATTGNAWSWLTNLLSARFFKVMSSLSYAVFLIHVEIMYKTQADRFDFDLSWIRMYSVYFIVASFLISFFMHLLFEMPINNIMHHYQRRVYNWFQAK